MDKRKQYIVEPTDDLHIAYSLSFNPTTNILKQQKKSIQLLVRQSIAKWFVKLIDSPKVQRNNIASTSEFDTGHFNTKMVFVFVEGEYSEDE